MEERINIQKQEGRLEISIKAFYDEKKQKVLVAWITLFTFCGLAIITQFFGDYDNATKVFFAVYVAFWLFFEFKVIYAYRWRKYGAELITVEGGKVSLIKTIGRRGVTQVFNSENIKKIDFYKDNNGKFIQSMNTSYWNINKYTLALFLENEQVPFAIDVPRTEAKKILHEVRTSLR